MTIDDFAVFVRDEIGLDVTSEDVGKSFDELPGWDSVHLLGLLTALERTTGRPLSLPDLLDAASLQQIYTIAVA